MGELGERQTAESLGRCPGCDISIPTGRPFIEYATPDDWPCMLAECPSCDSVVRPR